MSSKKITDLPKKSVSSEKAEDVKGGARKKFNKGGHAKKQRSLKITPA